MINTDIIDVQIHDIWFPQAVYTHNLSVPHVVTKLISFKTKPGVRK